jgi:hypothetical protein
MREYLQARIIESMQLSGAMIPLAFHGGTALRFLYGIPRNSEDLDFALERKRSDFELTYHMKALKARMSIEGYSLELRLKEQKIVHSASIRFPGLLYEMGLSSHRDETVSINVEVDTNPPAGARLETTVVRRYVTLRLQHHDRSTLLSGKLNSIMTRKYTKGRDIYDLFWYLADRRWPEPNLEHLNNALRQAGWKGESLTAGNWRNILREKIDAISWTRAINDVRPFLETSVDVAILTKENLIHLLSEPSPGGGNRN